MDPLSIASAVAGLLTLSAGIASGLEKFTSAYSIAKIVHAEMLDFRVVLDELQPLVLGSSFSDVARASMINLDQIEITLVGCVCTFSELEREVDRLGAAGGQSLVVRMKWIWSQSTLNSLVQRLQNHKASLALMLAIMTTKTHSEAMASMAELQSTIEQLMKRLDGPMPAATTVSIMTGRASTTASSRSKSSIQSSFERALLRTRLYKHSLRRRPATAYGGPVGSGADWSVLSGRSLSEISNIAVYELPVCASELYNPYWYGNLFPAVRDGDTETVLKYLGEEIAEKQKMRGMNRALLLAAEGGNSQMVKFLLHHGARDITGVGGATMLLEATRQNDHEFVKLLLRGGTDIDAKDSNGRTALMLAAKSKGSQDMTRLLLAASARINQRDADGNTALHLAAGNVILGLGVVSYLLNHCADSSNIETLMTLLLNHHGIINAKRNNGDTALHIAAAGGTSSAWYIVGHGADCDVRDADGDTALHIAARTDNRNLAELLLQYSANKDATCRDGDTALHIAARTDRRDLAALLLQHGANKDATGRDGDTALHIAARTDQRDLAALLLQHGANKDAICRDGDTAFGIAARKGNWHVADLLARGGASTD